MESCINPLKNCLWISADKECQSPVILRRFELASKVRRATLTVTGLGFFEARINDINVTNDRFLPLLTDYEYRDLSQLIYPLKDTTTHRIYYCEYDICGLLRQGENVLSIELGNGWYRQLERIGEGHLEFSDILKAIYRIDIETDCGNICICSDGSESWYAGERIYNNLFTGEVIDPGSVTYEEKTVNIIPDTASLLCKQIGTPDRVIRKITPVCLGERNGKKVYDAGENISGVVRAVISSPKGSKTVLRFSENINSDLSLNFISVAGDYDCFSGRKQIMEDTFISCGRKYVFEPKFTWHCFRYFEVEGDFDSLEVLVIHSNIPVTSRWESSSEGLNFLYEAYIRNQLDNMHCSIPSDCPHRERLGYTGDGQICATAGMLLFDSREFYKKWIVDILDCQDKVSGHVQHTAPLMGGGGGPGGWGCAIVTVPFAYYRHYGDIEMLKNCYGAMKLYINYMKNHSENGLVVREEDGGWCLGDWASLDGEQIPEPYVNSCYLVKCLGLLEEAARLTDNRSDIPEFIALKETVTAAIKQNYLNEDGTSYCGSVQGADVFAVWAGIEGADFAERIASKYEKTEYIDTGFLSTDMLFEVLFKYGYCNTALKLFESEKIGSFLYMKRQGATTLWEYMSGIHSHCHPMFGACVRQLFISVLGITQKEGTVGYQYPVIKPCIPKKLESASGSITTQKGEISVKWRQSETEVDFEITLPKDVSAEFVLNNHKQMLTSGSNIIRILK